MPGDLQTSSSGTNNNTVFKAESILFSIPQLRLVSLTMSMCPETQASVMDLFGLKKLHLFTGSICVNEEGASSL